MPFIKTDSGERKTKQNNWPFKQLQLKVIRILESRATTSACNSSVQIITLKKWKTPTCHRRTLPQSCVCIRWSLPSHSPKNEGRSVQCKKEERRTKTNRKRDQGREVKRHCDIWTWQEKIKQRKSERKDLSSFLFLLLYFSHYPSAWYSNPLMK